jgi:predicted ester cyclase
VFCRLVIEGAHQGTFDGIAPTGNSISVPAFTVLLMQDGKCVERWALADSLSLLTQTGAFPRR